MTTTDAGPGAPGGMATTMAIGPWARTVAGVPPIVTVDPGANHAPEIERMPPPEADPEAGTTTLRTGLGSQTKLDAWQSGFVTTTVGVVQLAVTGGVKTISSGCTSTTATATPSTVTAAPT